MTTAHRPTSSEPALTPRERLLEAADDLFYREGVHTVGIDRVIEQAGVARATLYNTFGSKDALVAAYLEARRAETIARLSEGVRRHRTPRSRLLGVFDVQGDLFGPDFHGCAFVNATAETHDDSAAAVAAAYRRSIRDLFTELAADAGARNPAKLAKQLHLLYDGVGLAARMDRDGKAAAAARVAAAALLDAAT